MRPLIMILCSAGLLLVACQSEPPAKKEPQVGQAFPTLPLPPSPELVSRSGSEDALQLTVRSPSDLAGVTEYYRTVLSQGKWRLVSDVKSADGSAMLYAEQQGQPLWVRIWKSGDRSGTMVQLTGAVATKDSVQKKSQTTTKGRPHRT
jgi:predicted component of type VI protein secretion system